MVGLLIQRLSESMQYLVYIHLGHTLEQKVRRSGGKRFGSQDKYLLSIQVLKVVKKGKSNGTKKPLWSCMYSQRQWRCVGPVQTNAQHSPTLPWFTHLIPSLLNVSLPPPSQNTFLFLPQIQKKSVIYPL